MPFVKLQTSCPVSEEQEERIRNIMGKAIECIPYKRAAGMLLRIEDSCRMRLGNETEETVYIEASLFGREDHAGFAGFARTAAEGLAGILPVRSDHVFVRFEDISCWSMGPMLADRKDY